MWMALSLLVTVVSGVIGICVLLFCYVFNVSGEGADLLQRLVLAPTLLGFVSLALAAMTNILREKF
jgi:hypothetical protein